MFDLTMKLASIVPFVSIVSTVSPFKQIKLEAFTNASSFKLLNGNRLTADPESTSNSILLLQKSRSTVM